jgi:hypothetical protein
MQNPVASPAPHASSLTRAFHPLGRLLLLAGVLVGAGCGGGGGSAKNEVSGKVTLGEKPVAGTVVFVTSDNKELSGPIGPGGVYTIADPPVGQAKIYIKAAPNSGGLIAPPTTKGGPEIPKDGPVGGAAGVAPPAKYTSAATSGLTFDVKAGKQTYDIPLTP